MEIRHRRLTDTTGKEVQNIHKVLFPLIDYTEVMGMYNEKSKDRKNMKGIRGE